jgi:pSer/pThr/pTyr-binding forkhead associated (FHA) protein
MERLIIKGITEPGTTEIGEGLTSIGRNPTNDIRVHDPTVSSFHCELIVSDKTVLVRDLDSTNGTFIESEPIKESFLRPWQVLRLGNAEFRLELEETPDVADVRIPQMPAPAAETDTHLLDGRLACRYHPGVAAVVRCTHCSNAFCAECVKPIRLRGGQQRLFCPACSRACEPIAADQPAKKQSILGRLTQTIRIKFRG